MAGETLCDTCEIRAACPNDESLEKAEKERRMYAQGILTYEEIGYTGINEEQVEAVKACLAAREDYTCGSFQD